MTARMRRLVEHVDHFQRRVIADALLDASATRWLQRADEFEAARPRLGDYHGGMPSGRRPVMATQHWPCVCRHGRTIAADRPAEPCGCRLINEDGSWTRTPSFPLPPARVPMRPGPPRQTREQLRARWDELTEIAKACRTKAALLRGLDMPDVLAAVDEVLEESA